MIVDETLRFVPPARITNRQAVAEDEVSGYRIPAGAVVAVSPYVLHRMPAWWPDTERFDPQRFAPDAEQERPRFAHMPFGGDPHPCISSIRLVRVLAVLLWPHRQDPALLTIFVEETSFDAPTALLPIAHYMLFLSAAAAAVSVLFRLRRASGVVRQQIKWLLC